MNYKKEYLTQIIEITQLIQANKGNDKTTIDQIKEYLRNIKSLGSFSPENWKQEWRKAIYKFGEEFKEKSPENVFNCINEEINLSKEQSEIEVLEFIKSEIFLNFFTLDESIDYLLEVSNKFNLNPDFKNSLAILYDAQGNQQLYCKYQKQAIKIEKNNTDWLESIYHKEYNIGKELIKKKKHKEANKFIQDIIDSNFYKNYRSQDYQNYFIFLQQRNDDQLLIENKLAEIDKASKIEINNLFEKSRLKIIEILGFFTAIIAFIFGAITITVKTELTSALILTTSFGLIMLIFTLALSIVFINTDKELMRDKRFWTLIIILLINISLIFLASPLTRFLKTIMDNNFA